MAKVRSFIALNLPEDLKNSLQNLQDELRNQTDCVRWVKPNTIHLTLKFLGAIAESQVALIAGIFADIATGVKPFTLDVAGVGAFPNPRNAKVIWIGLNDPAQTLVLFQKRLEDALAAIGFPPEKRRYEPHLTLGRVKERRGIRDIERLIERYNNHHLGCFTADTLVLYQSDLFPDGPVYSALKTIHLEMNGG